MTSDHRPAHRFTQCRPEDDIAEEMAVVHEP